MVRAALLAFVLILVPVPAHADEPPATAPHELVDMLHQAQQALDAQDNAEAAGLLERAFALALEDKATAEPQWLYLAAASWYRAGRPDDAARCLASLDTAAQDWEPSWLELAVFTALERGRSEEAARRAGQLAAREPGKARSWRLLAKARLEDGDQAGAAAALHTAMALGEATADDMRVLSDLHTLAELYLATGALKLGAQALERSLGDDPSPKDCDRLALVHARLGDIDAALAWMDKAQAKAPTARRMLDRGDLLREAGRGRQALEAYAGAARLDPSLGRAWLSLGYAAYDSGDYAQARRAFARAAAIPDTQRAGASALGVLKKILEDAMLAEQDPEGRP